MKLISREEIKSLIEQPQENCVSIYMPTVAAGPEVRQNPIRFKNSLAEAQKRLVEAGLNEKQASELLTKVHEIDRQDFWEEIGEQGLAIFISNNKFDYYILPLDFEELVVVSDRFHVKPLLPILNRNERFYILGLSQNQVRMMVGTRYRIQELDLSNVPGIPTSMDEALRYDDVSEKALQVHSARKGGTPPQVNAPNTNSGIFHGQGGGAAGAEEHKADIMRFMQVLAHTVETKILHDEQAPVVLAGVDYLLSMYKDVSDYHYLMAEGIEGNPENLNPQELHEKALPILEVYWNNSQQEVLNQFQESFGANTDATSTNIEEIVSAAYYQRVDSLMLAVGEHQWGLFDESSQKVYLHQEEETGDDDLFDFAAAYTLINGGTVYTVKPEQLLNGKPVAAIFRY